VPRASPTEAIVLAVNMPAQLALAGTGGPLDESEFVVAERVDGVGADGLEDASDVERLGPSCSARQDAAAVEEDARDGRDGRRPSSMPGSDLSTAGEGRPRPSKRSACMTVSTESAMISRETSEARMPS
jgi:hypothetical protein